MISQILQHMICACLYQDIIGVRACCNADTDGPVNVSAFDITGCITHDDAFPHLYFFLEYIFKPLYRKRKEVISIFVVTAKCTTGEIFI